MEEIYCFAGNPLDRVSQQRQDADWVASLLEDPETRVLPLHGLKPQIRHSSTAALEWQTVEPWRSLIDSGSTLILLGLREERAYFAIDATPAEAPADAKPGQQEEPFPTLLASADLKRGENAAKKCVACHTFQKDGPNQIGPNLWGIVNRPKASHAGCDSLRSLLGLTVFLMSGIRMVPASSLTCASGTRPITTRIAGTTTVASVREGALATTR